MFNPLFLLLSVIVFCYLLELFFSPLLLSGMELRKVSSVAVFAVWLSISLSDYLITLTGAMRFERYVSALLPFGIVSTL
jgi:hypothetical protein|nr:MAG TPA: hypothetical protein [Caudoviricetes sp.]